MLIGPVFSREVAITPRRPRVYAARVAYGLALLVLMSTAWLVLTGAQMIRDLGDLARFGAILFQLLAPLQLTVAVFFSALLAAGAVAHEKDRRTMVLLLLTKMTNSELVLGKLLASLLNVLVLLAVSLPVFMLTVLFGGVSFPQIARVFAVTLASVLVCGSLGSTLALWREKTFQALAMTVLVLVFWLALWEVVAGGLLGQAWLGLSCQRWAAAMSPWQAILAATQPFVELDAASGLGGSPVVLFVGCATLAALLLNVIAIARVRAWNASSDGTVFVREDETWHRASIWGAEYDAAQGADSAAPADQSGPARAPAAPKTAARKKPTRAVWDNPILWREICTWAYGRKMLLMRLAYLVLFGLAATCLYGALHSDETFTLSSGSVVLVPLFLLSLVLVNAQAVTSLTSERDGRALDLLLVSELTPKEIVYGKLGGVFYNVKEMVLLPMLLCGYVWWSGALSLENLLYVYGGLIVLYGFVAVLGLHAGMHYLNSMNAIGVSLGTVFFLFLGVATCMWMMVAFSSFHAQLQPFLASMVGGGVGLYVALGARNPSTAIGIASFACPFATFYAIASILQHYTLAVFLVTAIAYGFTTAAMLIPAICEFDVATGRTTIGE